MIRKRSFLTVNEVAQRFGINPATVYRLAQQGKLPAFKVGSQWRFSEEFLAGWIADQSRNGTAHGGSKK